MIAMIHLLKSLFGSHKRSQESVLPVIPEDNDPGLCGPVLVHDEYDTYLYDKACTSVEALQDIIAQGVLIYPDFGNLLFDVFAYYYKAQPELQEDSPAKINYESIAKLIQDGTETRRHTRYNILLSLLTAVEYGKEFLQHASEPGAIAAKIPMNDAIVTGALAKDAFSQRTKAINEVIRDWGLGSGELIRLSEDKVLQLANVLLNHRELWELAKQVGELRQLAREIHGKKLSEGASLKGITTGQSLDQAIPSEFINLGMPETENLFYEKLLNGTLLVHEYGDSPKAGEGAMVILADCSDSVSGEDGYLIKAVTMGLLEIAARQHRYASVVVFSGGNKYKEFTFAPGKRDPNDLADMITLFFGGGTSFEEPLGVGIERLGTSGFARGDIIMISDFYAPVEEGFLTKFKAAKDTMKFKFWALLLSDNNENFNRSLVELADKRFGLSLKALSQNMLVLKPLFKQL